MPSTTIRDIAKSLNISHTTVSRVLNGRGSEFISEATRQRVFTTARELRYRPNRAAKTLATGRTDTIAVWVGSGFQPYFIRALNETALVLNQHGLDMIHVVGHVDNDLNHQVDGILALDHPEDVARFLERAGGRTPVVSMGCYVDTETDHVLIDLAHGTRLALDHLWQTGRRSIAFVVSEHGATREGDARRITYVNFAHTHGFEPQFIIIDAAHDQERGTARSVIATHVREKGCPEALFCFSDDIALGVYRGLRDAGVRIPDDTALVGCDGISEIEYLDTPLSTIVQPHPAMCQKAWEFLKNRRENPHLPVQRAVLLPELVIRESSRLVNGVKGEAPLPL